eukprot:3973658-Pyramimonas_sp.AAC.1
MGRGFLEETDERPWLSFLLLLYPFCATRRLLCACVCDAFLSNHSHVRNHIPGTPEQAFEARLRSQARRHRAVARAWQELGVELFNPH